MTHVLKTNRLILRKPEASDVDAAVAFFCSDRAIAVGGPFTSGKAWRAFAGIVGHWDLLGYGPFTIEHKETGDAIGVSGPCFSGDYPEPELAWDIWSAQYEGKGFAYEASAAAKDYIFAKLGWKNLVSYVDDDNPRSTALAKRLGGIADEKPDMTFGDVCWVYRYPMQAGSHPNSGNEAIV
ncbi:MAG: GNAT family N-acetyltransferase [Paracoccaceae bacterium]